MENFSIALLILFHLAFFRRFYFANPFCYATSEPLDTAFPSSRLVGEWYRRWCRGEIDPYYYPEFQGIPFLQTFYLPNILQSVVGSYLSVDISWIIFSLYMVLHFLWASIGAYLLTGSLFGAITLGYLGYAVKQNACINCTLAWTPWLLLGAKLHNPLIFGISMGMGILAGYWPIWLYMVPLGCFYWLLV